MSKYRNAVFYGFKSQFLDVFSSNYRHRLVLKISFPGHIFPKISKYRTENLHFPSTGKYYEIFWTLIMQILTQIDNYNYRKIVAPKKTIIFKKMSLNTKFNIFCKRTFIVYIKCHSFGVKREMRPFWNKWK